MQPALHGLPPVLARVQVRELAVEVETARESLLALVQVRVRALSLDVEHESASEVLLVHISPRNSLGICPPAMCPSRPCIPLHTNRRLPPP